jgi:hypothetical protein
LPKQLSGRAGQAGRRNEVVDEDRRQRAFSPLHNRLLDYYIHVVESVVENSSHVTCLRFSTSLISLWTTNYYLVTLPHSSLI